MDEVADRLWHPWLRVNRLLRAMLRLSSDEGAWRQVKPEIRKALSEQRRIDATDLDEAKCGNEAGAPNLRFDVRTENGFGGFASAPAFMTGWAVRLVGSLVMRMIGELARPGQRQPSPCRPGPSRGVTARAQVGRVLVADAVVALDHEQAGVAACMAVMPAVVAGAGYAERHPAPTAD